jgi:hypothetical protein
MERLYATFKVLAKRGITMKPRHSYRLELEQLEQRDTPSSIHTTGAGQLTSLNPATGQATTAGSIDTGVLKGTTQFSGQYIDAQGDYIGQLVIVTRHGNVLVSDVGKVNADGTFTDHGTIVGGTGKFAGAAGDLYFQGHFLADGVHFVDDSIAGSIDI